MNKQMQAAIRGAVNGTARQDEANGAKDDVAIMALALATVAVTAIDRDRAAEAEAIAPSPAASAAAVVGADMWAQAAAATNVLFRLPQPTGRQS